MATLKQIRRRIRSVQSTQQITKAMEMVAAAKLRKAQARAEAAGPYARKMEQALVNLSAAARSLAHPLFEKREARRVLVHVVASDKGLCGAFNTNVFRRAEEHVHELGRENVVLVPVGKRACAHFGRRGWDMSQAVPRLGDRVNLGLVRSLGRAAVELFTSGAVDRVDFVSTRFVTTATRRVEVISLIPITPVGEEGGGSAYIFEPDAETIFRDLLPRYVDTRILSVLANTLAAEFAARMLSMGNANQNADEMISSLTLTANKLRQAAITRELSEIVGGTAALE